MRTVAEMVKNKQSAFFVGYQDEALVYRTECGFLFPIPLEDLDGAQVRAQEPALLLMRYIRKQHKRVSEGLASLEFDVSSSGTTRFVRFRMGNLVYVTEKGLEFPVPIEELAGQALAACVREEILAVYVTRQEQLLEHA